MHQELKYLTEKQLIILKKSKNFLKNQENFSPEISKSSFSYLCNFSQTIGYGILKTYNKKINFFLLFWIFLKNFFFFY